MSKKRFTERVFVAVELPRFARETLAEKRKVWRKQLEQDVKWVPTQQLRLILRYLGELEVSKSKQFCKNLEAYAAICKPFQLSVAEIGCTPSREEAIALWLSFERSDELVRLRSEIDAICQRLKLPADKKPFESRITLSKTSEPQRIPSLSVKPDFKGFKVRSLSLVESKKGQNGPTYHVLRKFTLKT